MSKLAIFLCIVIFISVVIGQQPEPDVTNDSQKPKDIGAKLTEEVKNIDINECTLLAGRLDHTVRSAIESIIKCLTDKLDELIGHIEKIVKVPKDMIDRIGQIQKEIQPCVNNINGVIPAFEAIGCFGQSLGNLIFTGTDGAVKIGLNVIDLNKWREQVLSSLVSCKVKNLYTILRKESPSIVNKIVSCINQKVLDVYKIISKILPPPLRPSLQREGNFQLFG